MFLNIVEIIDKIYPPLELTPTISQSALERAQFVQEQMQKIKPENGSVDYNMPNQSRRQTSATEKVGDLNEETLMSEDQLFDKKDFEREMMVEISRIMDEDNDSDLDDTVFDVLSWDSCDWLTTNEEESKTPKTVSKPH